MIAAISCSCRYKEGPAISFRSVKDRLMGEWEVTEYTSDGIDSLQYYKDSCGIKVSFPHPTNDNENWELHFYNCYNEDKTVVCTYNFHDNKKIMHLYNDNLYLIYGIYSFGPMMISGDWKILRLTKDDFKISTNPDNHNYLVTFKKI